MIITKLMGGLGNQMFQYAAGRRLAYIHRTDLKMDLTWFDTIPSSDTVRHYELSPFNIRSHLATDQEIARLSKARLFGRYARTLSEVLPFLNRRHVYEKHFNFNPEILKLTDDVYLEGYWQSHRYFNDIQDIIRNEFTVSLEPDSINRNMAEKISSRNSVSIHVRRGDYVYRPETREYHGTCSVEYYHRAVKMITSRVEDPHFFIFSDDPEWARKNLTLIRPSTIVDHNGPEKSYEDMRLMTMCEHHILANSSFSWWGAWLAENLNKIVISPLNWFKDQRIRTDDLLPETWIKI